MMKESFGRGPLRDVEQGRTRSRLRCMRSRTLRGTLPAALRTVGRVNRSIPSTVSLLRKDRIGLMCVEDKRPHRCSVYGDDPVELVIWIMANRRSSVYPPDLGLVVGTWYVGLVDRIVWRLDRRWSMETARCSSSPCLGNVLV